MIKRTHNLVKLFDIKSQRTREQYFFNRVCCRVSTFLQLKLSLLGALKLGSSNAYFFGNCSSLLTLIFSTVIMIILLRNAKVFSKSVTNMIKLALLIN